MCIYIYKCINGYILTEHLDTKLQQCNLIVSLQNFDGFEGMLSCYHPSRSADDRFKKFVLECHVHGLSCAICANRYKHISYSKAKADNEFVELTEISAPLESAPLQRGIEIPEAMFSTSN